MELTIMITFPLLSVFLVSCLIQGNCAFEGRETMKESHFHTFEMSSLLPGTVCTHYSNDSIKRPSTLDLFHAHSPCRKGRQNNASTSIASDLKEVLSNHEYRVNYIHNFTDEKVDLPVQGDLFYRNGKYLVQVGIGSPVETQTLIFDTGSQLTWTQCQPCQISCYPQVDPIFNPLSSASFSTVPCNSNECFQLNSATGSNPICSTRGACVYTAEYKDHSYSRGYLSKDVLSITAADVFPKFLFGCGQDNSKSFGAAAGLIGLGRHPLSLVSQTAQKYGKYFSYCLPSSPNLVGFLSLGKHTALEDVKFTKFDTSHPSPFYFITLTSIIVGGNQLPLSPTAFQNPGIIIDSGTVITRLPTSVYSALRAAFKQQMSEYPTAPSFHILDTCFDFSGKTSITFPKVSFIFDGGVQLTLGLSGTLVAVGTTHACLAFAGNVDSREVGIFGTTQQKTLEVVHDVDGGMLGFRQAACS